MALDNINLLSSSALSPNSDKILLYRSGGLEASTTLLSLTNSALNLSGVYLDPVNQRVGIGTNSPLATAHIKGIGTTSSTTSLLVQNSAGTTAFNIKDNGVTNATYIEGGMCWFNNINSNGIVKFGSSLSVGFNMDPIAQLQIKGSGSTSATTSLLVQNSAGSTAFKVKDNLSIGIGGGLDGGDGIRIVAGNNSEIVFTQGPDRVSLTRTNGDSLAIGTGGGVTYIKDGICNDGSNINFWKFEGAINSTVAMDTTKYLKVYVAGVPYKIAVCV